MGRGMTLNSNQFGKYIYYLDLCLWNNYWELYHIHSLKSNFFTDPDQILLIS